MEIIPGWARSLIGLWKKKLWLILMQKILQARCPSCHPTVSVKVLESLSITSCARGDTICPRPSPPSCRRADST